MENGRVRMEEKEIMEKMEKMRREWMRTRERENGEREEENEGVNKGER